MQDARRQDPALPGLEIDVERLRLHLARPAGHGGEHRAAVARDDVADLEPAEAELGEVVVEPFRQRRVHVDDRPVGLRRKKTRRRVVEIVDRVLEILEEGLVPVVLARLVRDGPDRGARPLGALERPDADAIPGHRSVPGQRRRQAQVFAGRFAGLRGLRQAVDRFGHVGRAGEQPLDRLQFAPARKRAVGCVGVKESRLLVGDCNTVGARIGDRLGGVGTARARGELQKAESEKHEAHGAEERQRDDRIGRDGRPKAVRCEPDRGGDGRQRQNEDGQQNRTGGSLGPVNNRRGRRRRSHGQDGSQFIAGRARQVDLHRLCYHASGAMSWRGARRLGRKHGKSHSFHWPRVLLWFRSGSS